MSARAPDTAPAAGWVFRIERKKKGEKEEGDVDGTRKMVLGRPRWPVGWMRSGKKEKEKRIRSKQERRRLEGPGERGAGEGPSWRGGAYDLRMGVMGSERSKG